MQEAVESDRLEQLHRAVDGVAAEDRAPVGTVDVDTHLTHGVSRQEGQNGSGRELRTVVDQIDQTRLDQRQDAVLEAADMQLGRGAGALVPGRDAQIHVAPAFQWVKPSGAGFTVVFIFPAPTGRRQCAARGGAYHDDGTRARRPTREGHERHGCATHEAQRRGGGSMYIQINEALQALLLHAGRARRA